MINLRRSFMLLAYLFAPLLIGCVTVKAENIDNFLRRIAVDPDLRSERTPDEVQVYQVFFWEEFEASRERRVSCTNAELQRRGWKLFAGKTPNEVALESIGEPVYLDDGSVRVIFGYPGGDGAGSYYFQLKDSKWRLFRVDVYKVLQVGEKMPDPVCG